MNLSVNPRQQNEFSETEATSKNRDEYNLTATAYNTWSE
jgi:hypothetical protein